MIFAEPELRNGFRLGHWRVEPDLNRVAGPGGESHLEPKVMQVLLCLACNAGSVVSRRDLESAVWGQAIVSDQTLTNCISELRRVLGDDRAERRFIETIPKRGYRLLAPVEALTAEPARPLAAAEGASAGQPQDAARRERRGVPLAVVAATGVILAVALGAIYLWAGRDHRPPPPVSPLTSFVGTEWTGSWSPDGSQIAFIHTDLGSADISVMSLGGGERRLVAGGPHDELTPRWSPDGSRIAYLSDRGGGLEVFWAPPTGGAERRVAGTGIPFLEQWMGIYALGTMPWSPDSRSLAFSRRGATGQVALWRAELASGETRPLTDPPAQAEDRDAAWSPDGRWIAFARYRQDGVGLWRLPAAGGEPEALLTDRHSNRGPSFSPDGERLVFFSNRGGSYDLWSMPADGGQPRQLTAGPGDDYLPVVSQTGRTLFTRWGHQTDLYRLDPTRPEAEHQRLTFNTRENYAPRVAPDGERIAYHSDRSGNYELWVLDAATGRERMLTDHAAEDVMPDWSPDGDELVFLSNRDGAFKLYVVNADGTGLRNLGDHTVPLSGAYAEVVTFGGPRWSPDGKRIGFVAPGASGPTLWTLDPAAGEAQASGLEHVLRFDWYLDAGRVVYLESPRDEGPVKLFAADLASGSEAELLAVPCAEIDVRPDGGAVAFVKAASHFGMNLYRLPLELDPASNLPRPAGEPEALTAGEGVWHVHGGGYSPDGRGLVYTRDLDHGDLYTIDIGFR